MRRRQRLARGGLEIHHIEGLLRRGNRFLALLQGIEPAKKLSVGNFAGS